MIPLQVRMSGWMRYREEQVVDFSGGSLISICGENGAGKSSIFDAITYALYGRHRLGAVDTEELITQDTDNCEVEFDFELAGKRWRVHRGKSRGTIGRNGRPVAGATTQALHAWDPGSEQWMPVPSTNTAALLQTALDNILHLTETAFTSSFLLRQGATTQFLDARPAERFRIISSLIDLEAYERLAESARRAATRERTRYDDLQRDLAPLATVTTEAVEAQKVLRDEAQAAVVAANDRLASAQALAADAKRFALRTSEIAELRAKIEVADTLLARADQIEADAATFQQLASVVETLKHLVTEQNEAQRLESDADTAKAGAAAIQIEALEAVVTSAGSTVEQSHKAFATTEAGLVEATKAERAAADFRGVATAVLQARARLLEKQTEAKALEARLAGLPRAQEEVEALTALDRALPPLRILVQSLARVETLERQQPESKLQEACARRDALSTEVEQLEAAVTIEEAKLTVARNAAATAQAQLEGWQEQLRQRRESADEAVCSRCGQPVTPEHAQAEIAELTARIAEAEAASINGRKAEAVASKALVASKTKFGEQRRAHTQLEHAIVSLEAEKRSLVDTRRQAEERRAEFVAVAPPTLMALVQDTDGPDELDAVLSGLADVPNRVETAERVYRALLGVQGQLEAVGRETDVATASVAQAEAAAGDRLKDVESADEAHTAARKALATANEAHTAARKAVEGAESAHRAAEQELRAGNERRAALMAAEVRARDGAAGHRRTSTALSRSLPDGLRERAQTDASEALKETQSAQERLREAPALLAELRDARSNRASWEGECAAKESEIAAIPEAHRLPPATADAEAAESARAFESASGLAQESAAAYATIYERLQQRERMESQQIAAGHRQTRFTVLARLLGRSGLQGALVTAALTTITSHANSFLDRLTGGSLRLELSRGNGVDELGLQAIDLTCMREARSVQALSGSQQFRCAVAMAFGIGEYCGAGGMRSIVIDEGFGSLDEIGQHQMIEELQALAEHMDKVIVVSHLDAFRDPEHFPQQVVIEKAGDVSFVRSRN